jgi:hypothetical protein
MRSIGVIALAPEALMSRLPLKLQKNREQREMWIEEYSAAKKALLHSLEARRAVLELLDGDHNILPHFF